MEWICLQIHSTPIQIDHCIQVNLGCYIFFKVVLHGILSIDSVPKSRDFLSPFGVHVSGLGGDKVFNKVEL